MNDLRQLDRNDILSMMRKQFKSKFIRLPEEVIIEITDEGDCLIVLQVSNISNRGIRENGNAFEVWALAIYLSLGKRFRIVLDTDEQFELKEAEYKCSQHFCKFLYRTMKFSEKYNWFSLSDNLQRETDKFKDYLSKGIFTNSVPVGDARKESSKECSAEAKLVIAGELANKLKGQFDVGNGPVYRQFPIGLYEKNVSEENKVFAEQKSAVNLWNINGEEFRIYELADWEKSIGIVTEIFFFSNFIRDLLLDGGLFTLNSDMNGDRGYRDILSMKIKKVKAILLSDRYHPVVSEEFVELMNRNSADIEYVRAVYRYCKHSQTDKKAMP